MQLTKPEQRVADALATAGLTAEIRMLEVSAHTAQMAADALGIAVGQIVKSLCFLGAESGAPYLFLVSGANRVHERRTGRLIGEKLVRADADFVKQATGFSIGGVAPLGHPAPLRTYLDEDLLTFATVWAAAGHPRSVFEIAPATLRDIAGADAICVT